MKRSLVILVAILWGLANIPIYNFLYPEPHIAGDFGTPIEKMIISIFLVCLGSFLTSPKNRLISTSITFATPIALYVLSVLAAIFWGTIMQMLNL